MRLSYLWWLSLLLLTPFVVDSISAQQQQLPAISIQNEHLVNSQTGQRFYVIGAGYDYTVSNTDAPKWKKAMDSLLAASPRINTLRFYVVDPTQQYDQFMNYMSSKGIYVIVPLTPVSECALNRDGQPALNDGTCYPSCLLEFGQQVINIFSKYTNTLAYTVGNEVINSDARWAAAPCVKAYAADLKQYQRSCSSLRYVPLIYSAADNAFTSAGLSAEANDRAKIDYLTCGSEELSVDMYGLNFFRWCNNQCSYSSCQYDLIYQAMEGVPVPVLFTEIGCENYHYDPFGANQKGQREWKEIPQVLSQPMIDRFDGAIAYTYGVRGGIDFSFFDDGDVAASGNPGYNKTCGYGGSNGNNVCNVDLFGQQVNIALNALGAAIPTSGNSTATLSSSKQAITTNSNSSSTITAGSTTGTATATSATGTSLTTAGLNSTSSNGRPTCPTFQGVDLNVPFTRQGAEGYTLVQCPDGSTPTARGEAAKSVAAGGDNSANEAPATQVGSALPASTTGSQTSSASTASTQSAAQSTASAAQNQGDSTSSSNPQVSPNVQGQTGNAANAVTVSIASVAAIAASLAAIAF